MREMPLISILMTLTDEEDTVASALDSVFAQTSANYELVIVDNACRNKAVLRALRKTAGKAQVHFVFSDMRLSPGAAFNLGLGGCKGKYVTFFSAQDTLAPEFIADAEKALAHTPDILIQGITEIHYNTKGPWYCKRRAARGIQNESLTLALDLAEQNLMELIYGKFFGRNCIDGQSFDISTSLATTEFLFTLDALAHAQTTEIDPRANYNYHMRLLRVQKTAHNHERFLQQHRLAASLVEAYGGIEHLDEAQAGRILEVYVRTIFTELKRMVASTSPFTLQEAQGWLEELEADPLLEALLGAAPKKLFSKEARLIAEKKWPQVTRYAKIHGYLDSFGFDKQARTES